MTTIVTKENNLQRRLKQLQKLKNQLMKKRKKVMKNINQLSKSQKLRKHLRLLKKFKPLLSLSMSHLLKQKLKKRNMFLKQKLSQNLSQNQLLKLPQNQLLKLPNQLQ